MSTEDTPDIENDREDQEAENLIDESEDLFGTESENYEPEAQRIENIEINDAEKETSSPPSNNDIKQSTIVHEKSLQLPLSRIKHIMKLDPDVHLTSQEAVFLVAKATELFIASLARETYSYTLKSKKKTMQRKDLDAAIEAVDALCFLEGAID